MFNSLLTDINFWSAFCGFLGSICIFFFGLPPKINSDGLIGLALEQVDEQGIAKGKTFKYLSYIGLSLLALSFILQIIKLIYVS